MATVTTTAKMVYSSPSGAPVGQKYSFEIHAVRTNTDSIILSWTDTTIGTTEYEELSPGGSFYFWNFDGEVWASSNSGTQTYFIQTLKHSVSVVKVNNDSPLFVWDAATTKWARALDDSSDSSVSSGPGFLAVRTWMWDQQNNAGFAEKAIRGVNASVSAANATNTIAMDIKRDTEYLSIKMGASGGTATVQIQVSVDNATWITVGQFAAALNTTATFRISGAASVPDTTGGAYTADVTNGSLHPLAFRFVRVVIGAAGVGNTTTTTITTK